MCKCPFNIHSELFLTVSHPTIENGVDLKYFNSDIFYIQASFQFKAQFLQPVKSTWNYKQNMAMRMPEGKGTYFGQNIATKYSKLEKKSKQTYVVLFIIAAVVTEVALHHTHEEYLISFT